MAKINDYSSKTRPLRAGETKLANAPSAIKAESESQKPLGRSNFYCMIIAGVMIVLGFLLMLGGSTTTEQFNESIFSTRRIVVGPTICFLGFVAMGAAIIIKPKRTALPWQKETDTTAQDQQK